jgi:hypothetical protein
MFVPVTHPFLHHISGCHRFRARGRATRAKTDTSRRKRHFRVRFCTHMVAACAETDKSEARSAPPCPIKHTRADCVCKNGQIKGKISTSVSVFAHTRRLRVQKRTNRRENRNPRVRFRTRTMATCAETDTLGSEPPPSCPKKHTHCGGVCTNGHLAEESASILKRLFAVANQPSVPDGCQTAPQRRFFF